MSIKRTDVHRPSEINPEDYVFVCVNYFPRNGDIIDGYEISYNRELRANHMASTGGHYSSHEHGGNCDCCGAAALYTATFYHEKTNTYIRVGEICANKLDMGEAMAFRRLRKGVDDARTANAGKAKAKAILSDLELSEAYDLYLAKDHYDLYEENIIHDIVSKVVRYGNISEKAANFVKKLLGDIKNRAAIKAERDAEKSLALDVPEGRLAVGGEVLKTKWVSNRFGGALKMLVKTPDGYLLWGSVPSNIEVEKGSNVSFKATLKKSPDDPKFGFFTRPVDGVCHNPKVINNES